MDPGRFSRRRTVLAGLLPLLLAATALFESQVDARIAAIGEPASMTEQTELKNLLGASALLTVVRTDLMALVEPEGLFDMGPLKGLARVGALIGKSGTVDTGVMSGFQNLYEAVDEWGDSLDDLYDAAMPSLAEKEQDKVQKAAQKAQDLQEDALLCLAGGQPGKATKGGAKALATFAKATALARKCAAD